MAESEGVTTSDVANSNGSHILQSKNGVNWSDKPHKSVVVFDCRPERVDAMERVLDINGLDFNDFLQVVSKVQ